MIRFFGKNNDLRTEEGVITKTGYAVMMLSSVFGLCVFFDRKILLWKGAEREKVGLIPIF